MARISELDVGTFLEYKLEEGRTSAIAGTFSFLNRIESAVVKGLINVVWKKNHRLSPRVLRFSVISILLWSRGYFHSGEILTDPSLPSAGSTKLVQTQTKAIARHHQRWHSAPMEYSAKHTLFPLVET